METKVNYAAVGVFVLALGAVFIAVVLWLAVGLGAQKHYLLYRAVINESVSGLNLNAPVKYLGVDVGKVHDITLDPANPQQVQLVFAIERGTPIKVDTEAVLKTQGLTGIAYVELSGGSPNSPPLVAATPNQIPEIRTKPSLSARLENVLSAVLTNLDRTAANINAILNDENRTALAKILADTSTVMSTLAAQKDNMKNGIANAARTADNTAKATAHLDALVKKVSATTDAVGTMANEATQASKSAQKTIEDMDAGVRELTGDTIPDINQLLRELSALSNSLQRLSDQTEKNPSSLLRGRQPAPYGPGEKKSP